MFKAVAQDFSERDFQENLPLNLEFFSFDKAEKCLHEPANNLNPREERSVIVSVLEDGEDTEYLVTQNIEYTWSKSNPKAVVGTIQWGDVQKIIERPDDPMFGGPTRNVKLMKLSWDVPAYVLEALREVLEEH
jgi:hypothetical protein